MQPTELQARLESEVMTVEWEALRPHFERGAVIWVSPEEPLVKVAMAVGLDLAEDVKAWMEAGTVVKVTEAFASAWSDDARFDFVIVQPFVLIRSAQVEESAVPSA